MIGKDISNELIYSTIRLVCMNEKTTSVGTAFFMTHYYNETNVTALITNKHVVMDEENGNEIYDNAYFYLSRKHNENSYKIEVNDLKSRLVFHKDTNVDLCFIFVNDIINEIQNNGISFEYRTLNTDFIINDEEIKILNPIESIIMIGYPIGLIDLVNNKPLIRQGITATSFIYDYNGKKEFVIDCACFPGSSGSPVFLKYVGLGKEDNSAGFTIGFTVKYKLIGVLYAGPRYSVNGEIIDSNIPCNVKSYAVTKSMVNLGYVIKPLRIMELFKQIIDK